MKSSFSLMGTRTRKLTWMLLSACVLCGLLPNSSYAAEGDKSPTVAPPTDNQTERALSPEDWRKQQEWRNSMSQIPQPKKGCFTAKYPSLEWQEVPCTNAPDLPYPPARGNRPQTVGGSNDFAGEVTGLISSATGSFDSITGVTSESGVKGNGGAVTSDTYSLQLNTKPFTTSMCSSSPNAGCLGWQQFVYSNAGTAFIQYWLLRFNTTCPSGFITFQFPSSTDIFCFKNGPNAVSVPVQPITNLANLSLGGTANAGGTDSIIMTTAEGTVAAANQDSILGLASGWKGAEFLIVGDCCGNQANFNAGSAIVVRTTVHHGDKTAPTCVLEGFTGETNNLDLIATPATGTLPSPAIISTQSNASNTVASCAPATGIGDTHLTTFNGLLYDFQASGDFILADSGPDFIVQTRQVSGAPT